MRHICATLVAIHFFLLLSPVVWSQNLSPDELSQLNKEPDFEVVKSRLMEKGFQFRTTQTDEITKETSSFWYFQPLKNMGEEITASLTKSVDNSKHSRITFRLFNVFHYKDFIDNLGKSKYKFKGMQVINNKSYMIFKNKNVLLLTTTGTHGSQPFYEISLKTE